MKQLPARKSCSSCPSLLKSLLTGGFAELRVINRAVMFDFREFDYEGGHRDRLAHCERDHDAIHLLVVLKICFGWKLALLRISLKISPNEQTSLRVEIELFRL